MNFRVRKTLLLVSGILLLIAGVGIAVTTVFSVFLLPSRYASTARIAPAVTNLSAVAAEVGKIQSEAILSQVITSLNLATKWGEKYREGELQLDVTRALLERDLVVRQSRNAPLVEIRVENDDPLEAAAIANTIANVYRYSTLAAKGLGPRFAVEIIETAQPTGRPVRAGRPGTIGIGCGFGVLLVVLGIALLVASDRKSNPGE